MTHSILGETNDLILVNKSAGQLSVPKPGLPFPVLSLLIREQYPSSLPLHRLDLETSGLILFAKNETAHKVYSLYFQKHKLKKVYLAIAFGRPEKPIFKATAPIDGKTALTQIQVLTKGTEAFFLKARITTGRRHQIRIHLSQLGHPVLGERAYGTREEKDFSKKIGANRVMLHSYQITLPSGEVFQAPPTLDFENLKTELFLQKNGTLT